MDYYTKYFKYKQKYLDLKGGLRCNRYDVFDININQITFYWANTYKKDIDDNNNLFYNLINNDTFINIVNLKVNNCRVICTFFQKVHNKNINIPDMIIKDIIENTKKNTISVITYIRQILKDRRQEILKLIKPKSNESVKLKELNAKKYNIHDFMYYLFIHSLFGDILKNVTNVEDLEDLEDVEDVEDVKDLKDVEDDDYVVVYKDINKQIIIDLIKINWKHRYNRRYNRVKNSYRLFENIDTQNTYIDIFNIDILNGKLEEKENIIYFYQKVNNINIIIPDNIINDIIIYLSIKGIHQYNTINDKYIYVHISDFIFDNQNINNFLIEKLISNTQNIDFKSKIYDDLTMYYLVIHSIIGNILRISQNHEIIKKIDI